MAAKIMSEQEFCQSCNHRQSCRIVYQQLCKAKGPSVVSRVVAAFLLPVVVFAGTLAVCDVIFAKVTGAETLRTVLSFLLALSVTSLLVLIMQKCRINGHKKH
jgi:hypothetical protein